MNRLTYDTCAYDKQLAQSTNPLNYILDPIKYENCQKCRMELGIVGGTNVTHISGSLVDLENDLRNQDRPNTHCPSYKFTPRADNFVQGKEYIKPVQHPLIDTTPKHLKPCQMIDYPYVPLTPALDRYHCNSK
jgi:hypothetical protein